jgi:hypothetical protein
LPTRGDYPDAGKTCLPSILRRWLHEHAFRRQQVSVGTAARRADDARQVRIAEPTPKLSPSSEPVVIAHAVTVILRAIGAAGWAVIPSDTINTIGSVVAPAVASIGAVLARGRVSPLKGGIGGYISEVVRAELDKYPDGRW